jgi:hypothetical protein
MNDNYPPLPLVAPTIEDRRGERPRPVPLSAEVIARRGEIAQRLKRQIDPISERLSALTDEQRRAVFLKLEHDAPVQLTGTGLRAITEPAAGITLAVPRQEDLSRLSSKLDEFATAIPRNNVVPHSSLANIQTIVEGNPRDRLSPTLLDQYEQLIAQDWVICEIEMTSLARGHAQRNDELAGFRRRLADAFRNHTRGTLFEHERNKGTIRAVIRCTGELFQQLVEDDEWQTTITWFEERPTFETFHQTIENFDIRQLGRFRPPPDDAPTVCVVDTGVTAGNPFLRSAVRDDDLVSFLSGAPADPSDSYGHGSGVASLVAYYALNIAAGGINEGKVWIASARILNEHNQLEQERLFSALLRRAVQRFVPRGVKIFNLSVNDLNLGWNAASRRTVPRRSWTARTIDQLSREFDVVFVVSTGNLLTFDITEQLTNGSDYPSFLLKEEFSLRDPGQAALAISVGSVAPTTLVVGPHGRAHAIAERHHPSPFTRSGPGIRREVKPEIVEYGGNYLFQEELRRAVENQGLNIAVASNRLTPPLSFVSGTSLAAARASHKLAMVLHDMTRSGVIPTAALLKALLINSASYPLDREDHASLVQAIDANNPRSALNVIGYGVPDNQRATDCDDFSVLMYFQGALEADKIAFFDIPVPAELQDAGRGTKKLTITVVHTPEVQRWGLEEYLGTVLKWRVFRGNVARDTIVRAMAEQPGNAIDQQQPAELPDELSSSIGLTARSRGTIQHDVFEWNLHRPEFSANHYTLAITTYERWGRAIPPATPIAVVVRLEETTRNSRIYGRVEAALNALRVPARVTR